MYDLILLVVFFARKCGKYRDEREQREDFVDVRDSMNLRNLWCHLAWSKRQTSREDHLYSRSSFYIEDIERRSEGFSDETCSQTQHQMSSMISEKEKKKTNN